MKVELIEESRRRLYESRDFVELAALGHELTVGAAGFDPEAPMEASFHCRSCGDQMRFRDLAWGFAPEPRWVLAEISGGAPEQDCRARRLSRTAHQRLTQMRSLERWKRLRWRTRSPIHFN